MSKADVAVTERGSIALGINITLACAAALKILTSQWLNQVIADFTRF